MVLELCKSLEMQRQINWKIFEKTVARALQDSVWDLWGWLGVCRIARGSVLFAGLMKLAGGK